MIKILLAKLRAIAASKGGNVSIIFALSVVPMLFAMGMGIDYVSAARRKDRLASVADAAALAAVTPVMMTQSSDVAKAAATAMFNAQFARVTGVALNPNNPVITVTDTSSLSGTVRNASVTFSGTSTNIFPNVLQATSITLGGAAASQATTQPNTNFYLLLDTSPSMLIASNTTDIAKMVANTTSQGGCAFACHETNPAKDHLGNPGGEDNYALAKFLGVSLRIDLVVQAVQNLMDTAQATENTTNAQFQMSIWDFDATVRNVVPMTSNLTAAKAGASLVQPLTVAYNGYLTNTNYNNDQDTNWDSAISGLNAAMSTPGNGTKNIGDSPQEVLFLVTDGLVDEANGSTRNMSAMGGSWCTTIKNRGIRIAVLYTTYNPLPTNSFYNANIKPFQPSIATSLQACASSPNLFFQVNTGGDISAALNALFLQAVGVAHLTQ